MIEPFNINSSSGKISRQLVARLTPLGQRYCSEVILDVFGLVNQHVVCDVRQLCETCWPQQVRLRIGGPPLWLYDPEQHVSRDGEPMTYVAAIGYDTNADSPFLDDPEMLMFGEMGLYFFVSPKLSEIVVSCQST